MKKIYGILFLALLSLLVIFTLSACGSEDDSTDSTVEKCLDDEHEYYAWETIVEAFCNTQGVRQRSCGICGHTQQQRFTNSTNHVYENNICIYCGDSLAPDDVEFILSDDKSFYILANVGDKDATEYEIPAIHKGLPIKQIAAEAFKDCTKLETITVPDSVSFIGEGAFAGCYSLKSISIPFVGRDRTDDHAVFGFIFGQEGYPGSVGITQTVNGVKVDYWLPSGLVDVTVTGGELYDRCFENCTKIKRIKYEGEGEAVGDRAFSGCVSLDSVSLTEDVTKYGDRAFQNCIELDIFQLDNIREIGIYCFAGCMSAHLNIPDTLRYVGKGAFAACPNLTTVTIGNSVKNVADNMFQDCPLLESVLFGSSVEKIGEAAFSGCPLLASVNLPSSVEEIEETAFKDCTGLLEVNIPANVEIIGDGAFQGCTMLKTVTIEKGVTTIGKYAFSKCSSIETIEIPTSVSLIDENAFAGCDSLKNIAVVPGNPNYTQIDGNVYSYFKDKLLLYSPGNDQDSFVIPEGVTEIDPSAFMNAPFLKEVVFPSTMKKIPTKLFYMNQTLKSIVIKSGMEIIDKEAFAGCTALVEVNITGVPFINEGAFTQCNMLKTVTIDSSTIGKGAFHSCPSLETVNLTNIDVVGDNSFANCFSLINLNIGQGVGIISAEAFSNCTKLETVVFNSSVTSIGEFCFSDCKSLKNVQFGANLSNIGEACFRNCTSIETIHITSSIANINAYAFEGCTGLKSFTVSDANSRYEAVEGHLVDERKCLVVFAFGNITDGVATIPDGVVSLGTFLFRNVKDLKSVVFPSSLKEIGNEAFYNSGIESINLNGIEIIGEYAFGKCLSLKDVTIPKTVTTIKDYAFQDSIYLENVYIRSSVVNVGTAIFHVTDTLKEQLQLIEVPEIMVYIEHTVLPDTWVEAWSKGSNIIEIMGHYFND